MLSSDKTATDASLSGVSSSSAFDDHEMVITLTDKASGLKAFVAIHNSNLGPTHGGTRMKLYPSDSDALEDALELSKAMSYKSALANLPYGGAKGVIVLDPASEQKTAVLQAYARRLNQMNGLFRTGTDVGLTDTDTLEMAKDCKYILGTHTDNEHGLSTSKCAAKGVFYSIQAALLHKYGSSELSGKVVGIKGVGKLGSELAGLLSDAGATVLIADINKENIQNLKQRYPNVVEVDHRTIHQQEMNVFAPCALGHEFSPATIAELACEVVCGGANNQLSDDTAGAMLYQKGILYVPDYVANAGGLIFVSEDLEADGFSPERIEARLSGIRDTLKLIFERSQELGLPTNEVADHIARERIYGTNS